MFIIILTLWLTVSAVFVLSRNVAMKERTEKIIKRTFQLFSVLVVTVPVLEYSIKLYNEPLILNYDYKQVGSIEVSKICSYDNLRNKTLTSTSDITNFSSMLAKAYEISTPAKSSGINYYKLSIHFIENKTLNLRIKESVKFGTFVDSKAKQSSLLVSYYRNDSLKIFLDSLFFEPCEEKDVGKK